MSKSKRILSGIGVFAALSVLFLCTIKQDNGSLVPTGPNTQTDTTHQTTVLKPVLIVTPDSSYVGVRETLSISITVMKDSALTKPAYNQRVICTVSGGWLSAETLVTNAKGRATVKFYDTTKSIIDLHVVCGTVDEVLHIDVTDAPEKIQKQIQIVPEKPELKADGKDQTAIDVTLMDVNHNPIVGQCVQFMASAGLIVGSGKCANSGQGATDDQGKASAILTSSNVNDTSYVTAFLASDRTKIAQTKVVFKGVNILISADSTNLKPGSTTTIKAILLNGSNEPIPYAPIYFIRGKDTLSNLTIMSRDSVTGPEGNAQCVITGVATGTDSVRVSAAGANASIKINVTDLLLSISLDDKVLQAMDTKSTTLHVFFSSKTQTALAGKDVQVKRSYKTRSGMDTSDILLSKTDAQGKCAFTISALPYEASMNLEVTAFNTTSDVASASTSISFMTTRTMTIYAVPTVIQADGTSKSTITVQVKNEVNNPIVGDLINFTTDAGLVTSSAATDSSGRAFATVVSDRRNTIATVKATLARDPTKYASVKVEFSGVELTANANPPSINSSGKDSSTISITLLDAAKNPIVGEPINFSKLQDSTFIFKADSVTNNRGEAKCKVFGKGAGVDTIRIEAAGASVKVAINYSSNYLVIDTAVFQPCIANGNDSTQIRVTYLAGDKITPVPQCSIDVSLTLGNLNHDVVFSKRLALNPLDNGRIFFWIKNPNFANTSTIFAYAKTSSEVTTASFQIYFRATKIKRIDLIGSPSVLATNGSRAKLTASAYDSLGNRVKDERLTFNMFSGPGSGEYLDPATAITADDGTAIAYLVSGKTPSMFHGVGIVASDITGLKSDSAFFTIAGPPYKVAIGVNIAEGHDFKDGTYGLPCAAIVTDINGNPVADGTAVTFSIQTSGFVYWRLAPTFDHRWVGTDYYCFHVDTLPYILPFEDFNNNFRLDPGEDRNNDGFAGRGADLNGDGIYDPGPPYEDINHDGKREFGWTNPPVEPRGLCAGNDTTFIDLNGDGLWDPIEPLSDTTYLRNYNKLKTDSAFYKRLVFKIPYSHDDSLCFDTLDAMDALYTKGANFIPILQCYDFSWNKQPYPQPDPAISIMRTVQTLNGKAVNEMIYGQTNANRVEIMLWAESQGIVSEFPAEQILPIVK